MNICDVFISYRRSDGLRIAEALYKYLTNKGLRVFLDTHEMIDGHYFTTQIESNLKIAPNYILVATEDVFKFRDGEDWVQKEIEVAIEEYESKPTERTLTVLAPDSVIFPEKAALPESVCNIADAQRIPLPYGEDFAETFYKILKSVTNINRRNLWFAAHRWLENSKCPGGRFASLNINENILPNASIKNEQKEMPINVYSKDKQNESRQPLLDAMEANVNHFYLIGQGGIGKTTALMHIMNTAYADKQYSENAQIPIFVELSFAPDTYGALYEGGKSSFIRRSIYKQVRADRTIKQITAKEISDVDEVFASLPYDVAVQPITDILSKATPAPEYLLLLDGLNEVSSVTIEETGLSVVQMIVREIDLLLTECPNVRVVLTSRSDESAIYNDSVSRLYLSGIEEKTIKEYLESFNLSKDRIDKVLEDKNLCETLQIPLFLTMYASLSGSDDVSTQGEILKMFFNERRKNISVYTMQERLAVVEKNVTDVASAVQKNRIDADMQNFILDFILPEIAWNMERDDEFYLRVRDIRKIIEPILTDTDDLAVCGEFGREIFSKYRNGASAKMHTYKVAKKIIERFGNDITEITEGIINCCVFALGIMQENFSKYGFVHQHIRDYFAAVKDINAIRLSVYLYEKSEKELALECMNKTFKDEPVNYTVRRFIGEYLGEHRNKPYYANEKWNYGVPTKKCDRNLIKRALDIYRGYFNGEFGYGVYSLVEILNVIRQDLSGADFSELDLYNLNLNGVCFSRPGIVANFLKAKISGGVFMPIGHTEAINSICCSKDGRTIVTASEDRSAKIWDTKTLKNLGTLNGHKLDIYSVCYSPDERIIVTASWDKTVKLWDSKMFKELGELKGHLGFVFSVAFSPDGKKIVTTSDDGSVKIWDIEILQEIKSLYGHRSLVCCACFSPDGKKIASASRDKTVRIWDANTYDEIGLLVGHSDSVNFVSFNPDGKTIITASDDNTVKMWDAEKYKEICSLNKHKQGVLSASFSPKGNYILSSSYDKTVMLWDATSLKHLNTLIGHTNWIRSACMDYDEKIIITASDDKTAKIWDVKTGRLLKTLTSYEKRVSSACYSPNGENIVVSADDKTAKIWNEKLSQLTGVLIGHKDRVNSASYNNTGDRIVTASSDGKAMVWNADSGNIISDLSGHKSCVYSSGYNSNGKYIATVSDDKTVKIWDADSLEELYTHHKIPFKYFIPHRFNNLRLEGSLWDAAFRVLNEELYQKIDKLCNPSPRENLSYSIVGTKTVTSGYGYPVIWDMQTFKKIGVLNCRAISANFNPNGKKIVTVSPNGIIQIWSAKSFRCLKTITNIPGLFIVGVDLRNINNDLGFTDEEKQIFRQYGAIID